MERKLPEMNAPIFIPLAKNARRIDGRRIGRLVALGPVRKTEQGIIVWLCRCDCGNQVEVRGHDLRANKTKSCGCINKEVQTNRLKTHGKCFSSEYRILSGIKTRCTNQLDPGYKNYGGRGIVVCERWMSGDGIKTGFECFLEDMGQRPSREYSIERLDNNGPYSKENCIWATDEVQGNNRRDNLKIVINGITKTATQWAREKGFRAEVIYDRIRRGWSEEDSVLIPYTGKQMLK
jgi:hypothetical protein